ncbi:unnamed protein product [Periconia digitata]|uniref:Uncharacterized protein n=1 Tax=Periconia digitata TaxID=1303443 RepID=A0A9W4UE40_9PLEO|nr:unnamed protein product [Periconia digitata]
MPTTVQHHQPHIHPRHVSAALLFDCLPCSPRPTGLSTRCILYFARYTRGIHRNASSHPAMIRTEQAGAMNCRGSITRPEVLATCTWPPTLMLDTCQNPSLHLACHGPHRLWLAFQCTAARCLTRGYVQTNAILQSTIVSSRPRLHGTITRPISHELTTPHYPLPPPRCIL